MPSVGGQALSQDEGGACRLNGLRASVLDQLRLVSRLLMTLFIAPHTPAGYVYCNGPDIEVPANTTTRFVLLGMGSEADLHSPVFVGQVRVFLFLCVGVGVVGGGGSMPGWDGKALLH